MHMALKLSSVFKEHNKLNLNTFKTLERDITGTQRRGFKIGTDVE